MTGTDLCVNKPVTVAVIFEPPCVYIYIYTQSVTGGTDQTPGECFLGQTIPM